jgi:hypothetical protein
VLTGVAVAHHGPYRKGAQCCANYVLPYMVHAVTCPTHPTAKRGLYGLYYQGKPGVLMLAQGPTAVDTLVEAATRELQAAHDAK